VDPVPDPLLLRKSGSAGDRTRDLCICSSNKLYFVSSVNVSASLLFPFQDELMQEFVYSLFVKHIGNSGCLDHYIFLLLSHKILLKFHCAYSLFFPSSFTV